MLFVRQLWIKEFDNKIHRNFNGSIKADKVNHIVKYYNKNIKYLLIRYKTQLIAVKIFYTEPNDKFIDAWYFFYLPKDYVTSLFTTEEDKTCIKYLYNRGVNVLCNYLVYKLTNIPLIYIAGHRPKEKGIGRYKNRIADGHIRYVLGTIRRK